MRQFYLAKNSSGYYRVFFIDPVTGKQDSGKSTHSKDKVEATMIATSWLQNGVPAVRGNSRQFGNNALSCSTPLNLSKIVERLSQNDAQTLVNMISAKFGINATSYETQEKLQNMKNIMQVTWNQILSA